MPTQTHEAIVCSPTLANSEWYMGLLFSYLVSPAIGAESIAVIDARGHLSMPPPPHFHTQEDELFWTRSPMRFMIGQEVLEAPANALVYMPRGVPHAFEWLDPSDAGCLIITVPGAFSGYFRAFGTPASELAPPRDSEPPYADLERMLMVGQEFGVTFLPAGSSVHQANLSSTSRGIVADPSMVKPLNLMGMELRILIDAEQSNGALTAFTVDVPPGFGPPMHIHHDSDEVMILLEGDMEFLSINGSRAMKAGEAVYIPRGTAETYRAIGNQTAKLLVFQTPGGGCGFFRESEKCTSLEELVGIATRYHVEVVS